MEEAESMIVYLLPKEEADAQETKKLAEEKGGKDLSSCYQFEEASGL